jgi:hypothetical protein
MVLQTDCFPNAVSCFRFLPSSLFPLKTPTSFILPAMLKSTCWSATDCIDWCRITITHAARTDSYKQLLQPTCNCVLNISPVSSCLLHDQYYVCSHSEVSIVPLLSWLVFIYVTDERQRRGHPIGQLVLGKRRWLYHHNRIVAVSPVYSGRKRFPAGYRKSRKGPVSFFVFVCPSVRPSFFIYQLYIIYHVSIWLPLYLYNTYEQKLCCLSVATRHKVTIQATTACWWSNIQGIVTVELTSATDWRLSSTIPLQLRSACKVSVVVFCTFPKSTICVGQFLFNLRIQRCSSVLIPTTRNTVVCKKSITV